MRRMRMSMITTSGECADTRGDGLVAVARLRDDHDVRRAAEDHRQAGAHERVVVDEQHPQLSHRDIVRGLRRPWPRQPGADREQCPAGGRAPR